MVESNYSLSGCIQESPYHCGMSVWRWWSNTLWATLIRLWLHSSFGWSAGCLFGHRGWVKLQSIWMCSRVSVALCYVYFKVMVWQIVSNSHKVWLHSLLCYLQVVLGRFLCNFDRYILLFEVNTGCSGDKVAEVLAILYWAWRQNVSRLMTIFVWWNNCCYYRNLW
jgi:hypothetical protein